METPRRLPYAFAKRHGVVIAAVHDDAVEVMHRPELSAEAIADLAQRFAASGPSLAVGPGLAGHHRNATAANLAVHVLNSVAGNVGRTVHLDAPEIGASSRPYGEMQEAIASMAAGSRSGLRCSRARKCGWIFFIGGFHNAAKPGSIAWAL